MSLDPAARLKITQSIVDHGDIQMRLTAEELEDPRFLPDGRIQGPDGKYYARFFGLGQTLVFVPSYYFSRHVLHIESDKLIRSLIAVTLFPLILGLTAVFFFLLLREFNVSPTKCYIGSILLIFGTGLWELSRECQDGSQLALLFTLAALGLRKYQKTALLRYLFLAAFAMGYGFITRSDTAPTILCFLVFTSWLITRHNRTVHGQASFWKKTFPFFLVAAAMLPFLFIEIAYNLKRFGHPISSYSREFSVEIFMIGFKGLLYSPGKSFFLYNPIMLLFIPGLFILWRRRRPWVVYIVAGFTGCFLLHAAVTNFHGNICWGPRYLLRYLPLLFIPVMYFGFYGTVLLRLRRTLFILLAICSVLVQIAAVSLHYNRENGEMAYAYGGWSVQQWTMFEPEAHFLKHRIKNIRLCLYDMTHHKIPPWPKQPPHKLPAEEQLKVPVLHYLAFWPYHLTYYMPAVNPKLTLSLWQSTLLLLAGITIGLLLLRWGWKSSCRME